MNLSSRFFSESPGLRPASVEPPAVTGTSQDRGRVGSGRAGDRGTQAKASNVRVPTRRRETAIQQNGGRWHVNRRLQLSGRGLEPAGGSGGGSSSSNLKAARASSAQSSLARWCPVVRGHWQQLRTRGVCLPGPAARALRRPVRDPAFSAATSQGQDTTGEKYKQRLRNEKSGRRVVASNALVTGLLVRKSASPDG